MAKAEDYLNIHQRLVEVSKEVGKLTPKGKAPDKAGGYGYFKYDDIATELRNLFNKYGVIPWPSMGFINQEHSPDFKAWHTEVSFSVDFVCSDNPDDHYKVEWLGEGNNYGDKGTQVAGTSAWKFLMMNALMLRGGIDSEAELDAFMSDAQEAIDKVKPKTRDDSNEVVVSRPDDKERGEIYDKALRSGKANILVNIAKARKVNNTNLISISDYQSLGEKL